MHGETDGRVALRGKGNLLLIADACTHDGGVAGGVEIKVDAIRV